MERVSRKYGYSHRKSGLKYFNFIINIKCLSQRKTKIFHQILNITEDIVLKTRYCLLIQSSYIVLRFVWENVLELDFYLLNNMHVYSQYIMEHQQGQGKHCQNTDGSHFERRLWCHCTIYISQYKISTYTEKKIYRLHLEQIVKHFQNHLTRNKIFNIFE